MGYSNNILVLPWGRGKTLIAARAIKEFQHLHAEPGKPFVLYVVRKRGKTQTIKRLREEGLSVIDGQNHNDLVSLFFMGAVTSSVIVVSHEWFRLKRIKQLVGTNVKVKKLFTELTRLGLGSGMLIVDEIQAFKNYDSLRSKELQRWTPYFDKILGLTATPTHREFEGLPNPEEFFGLLKIVAPRMLKNTNNYYAFRARYGEYETKTVYTKNRRGRSIPRQFSNIVGLTKNKIWREEYLLWYNTFVICIDKTIDMPVRTRLVSVTPTTVEKKLLTEITNKLQKSFHLQLGEIETTVVNRLVLDHVLRKVSASPRIYRPTEKEVGAKINFVVDLVDNNYRHEDKPIIIYCYYRQQAQIVYDELCKLKDLPVPPTLLMGGEDVELDPDTVGIIVATIAAGDDTLDLWRHDSCFLDVTTSTISMRQALGRVDRLSNVRDKIITVVVSHPVDWLMLQLFYQNLSIVSVYEKLESGEIVIDEQAIIEQFDDYSEE